MASVPRILVVDPHNQIGIILRGAMTMLNRRYILVEVPTAQDALTELTNSDLDLLVSAFALPDSTGVELAARSIRESAGTPVIILADVGDPELEPEIVQNAPYTYLMRPVGEQFIRALRIGLGEAVVAEETSGGSAVSSLDLGPLPELDQRMLQDHIMGMVRETMSAGVFVADRLGRVVFSWGQTGYFDINACAAVLSQHFTNTVHIRELISGTSWSLQYFDGEDYDLFALSLGLHYFVVLINDGSNKMAFSAVIRDGRKGAESIADHIGPEAWTYRKQAASRMTQTIAVPAPSQIETTLDAMDEEPLEPADLPLDLQPTQPFSPAEEIVLEPIQNLDVDKLFGQNVDESQFDDLFSEDDLNFSGANGISFEEAMNMGILDE